MTRLPLLMLIVSALTSPSHAAPLDPTELGRACDGGDAEACLSLARAQTGVALPVDILAAQDRYQQACSLGSQDGCQGAQGVGRYLGRHVELSFLSSVPRVWALSGPARVTATAAGGAAEGASLVPAESALTQALLARLPFAEACYAAALQDNSQLQGLLDVSLIISDGGVAELDLHQSDIGDEGVARCMVAELGRAQLPADTAGGEIFLRLRAEPGPASRDAPPVVQDHLADGAQTSIGEPRSDGTASAGDARRLEIALTVAVRRALSGSTCVLDELRARRWDPVGLVVQTDLPPDGVVRGLRVQAQPSQRRELADCVGRQLQELAVGRTGAELDLSAELVVRVGPAWTATIVP